MINLNDINLKDLRQIGKELKIKGFATLRKLELMTAISDEIGRSKKAFDLVQRMTAEIEPSHRGQLKPSLGVTVLTFNGKTQSIGAWADEIGLKRPALYDRINRQGWTVEEALTIPAGGRRRVKQLEGQLTLEM